MSKYDENSKWRGPRNLPKPSAKKAKRTQVKKARKRNRGAYSGQ
jgi:hypothetical protein